jgi:hypothetical protein
MKRSSTHILTTHAGSLIRPAEIVEAMIQDHLREPLDQEKFSKDLRVAVEDVVKKQADVGIDVVDDGEFGKSSWIAYLVDRFDGLVRVPLPREVLEAPSPDRIEAVAAGCAVEVTLRRQSDVRIRKGSLRWAAALQARGVATRHRQFQGRG